jgi:hypothetical protein
LLPGGATLALSICFLGFRVTVDGEKLQVAPVGNPVPALTVSEVGETATPKQAKETAAANPFSGVMVIVEVPLERQPAD